MDSDWYITRLALGQSLEDLTDDRIMVQGAPAQERQKLYMEDRITLIQGTIEHRYFMTSVAGRIGLAPEEAQDRDAICVLFGCATPVVLLEQKGRYLLIEEWYALCIGILFDCWTKILQVMLKSQEYSSDCVRSIILNCLIILRPILMGN
jgi:hypothetical protein